MTTTVLAYFPSPGQGVWYLGSFPIRAYALCIIAGIIAALLIGDRRWAARGGERGVIYDIALWAVPFGLVGGRLYHVLTDWKTYFGPGGAGIRAALSIWEGGLGIWGAVALGAVGAWIGCRRKGIPLPAFGDAVAPGVVLAQAIGRLGNYFNQELYGRETTVPWGMEVFYRSDSSGVVGVHSLDGVSTGQVAAVVHPTFLYELLWNLLVFVFLIWADRRFRLGHGRLFALYVAAYSVGRFGVELMRDDAATHIAGIRINVFTATFVFIGALVYFLLAPKGRENPETLRGKQSLEADEEESLADEWSDDLMSAATGSGVLAAATVAGEHEGEDSEAVGDVDEADLDQEDLDEADVDESDVDEADGDEADVDEIETADAVDAETDLIEAVVTDEAAGEPEPETADASEAAGGVAEIVEDTVEGSDAVEDTDEEAQASEQPAGGGDEPTDAEPTGAESDTEPDDETVIVYHSPDEAAAVVVYESGEESGEEPGEESGGESEEESGDESGEEPRESEEDSEDLAPSAEDDLPDAAEMGSEPDTQESDEPEPEPATETDGATEVSVDPAEPNADGESADVGAQDQADAPKLGKTLKRLLWGAGNRRGG